MSQIIFFIWVNWLMVSPSLGGGMRGSGFLCYLPCIVKLNVFFEEWKKVVNSFFVLSQRVIISLLLPLKSLYI